MNTSILNLLTFVMIILPYTVFCQKDSSNNKCFIFDIISNKNSSSKVKDNKVLEINLKDIFNPAVIEYHNNKNLRKGDSYSIKLDSLNHYLYNVAITTVDSFFEYRIPFPSFELLPIESTLKLISDISVPNITISGLHKPNVEAIVDSLQVKLDLEKKKKKNLSPLVKDYNENEIKSIFGIKIYTGAAKVIVDNKSLLIDICQSKIKEQRKYRNIVDSILDIGDKYISDIESYSYEETDGMVSNFDELTRYRTTIKGLEELRNKIERSKLNFILEINSINEEIKLIMELYDGILYGYDMLINSIKNQTQRLNQAIELVMLKRISFDKKKLISLKQLFVSNMELLDDFENQIIKSKYINGDLNRYFSPDDASTFTIEDLLDKRNTFLKQNSNIVNRSISLSKSFVDEMFRFNHTGIENDEILQSKLSIDKAYEEIIDVCFANQKQLTSSKVEELMLVITNINNNKTSTYEYHGKLNGDRSEIFINVSPAYEEFKLPSFRYKYTLPQKKNYFMGLSNGFYYSWLVDDVYSIREIKQEDVEVGNNFSIIDEGANDISLGFYSSFALGWYLNKSDFGIGLNIGPGISIGEKVRPNLLLGLNLSYGTRNKISIGAGLISGIVERKSRDVNLDDVFSEPPSKITVTRIGHNAYVNIGHIYSF